MTNADFKKLLDEAIKPVNDRLEKLGKSLNELRKELKEVKDTQEQRVLPSLIYIEATVKSYADRYVANEDHIGRLQKRVGTAEDKLGIIPPQDLTI